MYKEGIILLEAGIQLHLPVRQHNAPDIARAHDLRKSLISFFRFGKIVTGISGILEV